MNDLISIVIPVFNGAKFLKASVGSALAQSYPDVEVIVVNDGSEDGSGKVAEELQGTDSRVRVININNSGVTAARRVGIENATGKWICFLDVDDTLPEGALKEYSGLFKKNPEIIASGEKTELTDTEYKVGLMMRKCHPELWGKLFRADFIKKFYPELDRSIIVGEDQIINLVLANNSSRLETINSWLYSYNLENDGSVMKRFRRTCEYEIMFERAFNRIVRPGIDPTDSRMKYGEYKMKIEGFKMVVMDGNRFVTDCEEWREITEYYRNHPRELAWSEKALIRMTKWQKGYQMMMHIRERMKTD